MILDLFMVLLLLLCIYLVVLMPRFRKPDSRTFREKRYYAHRGLYDNEHGVPENSLLAFRKAVNRGYGIEMDVQLTSDGVPVIFHDYNMKRMCGIDRAVTDMTLKELQQVRLLGTDERIPTFHEFLELVNGRVPLIVEIKTAKKNIPLYEATDRELSEYGGLYCIESFHPTALIWYKKHHRDIFRGQLSSNFRKEDDTENPFLFFLTHLVTNIVTRPDFIAYNCLYRKNISRQICCKLYGAVSVAWTIRSQEELEECRDDFQMFIFEGFLPQ